MGDYAYQMRHEGPGRAARGDRLHPRGKGLIDADCLSQGLEPAISAATWNTSASAMPAGRSSCSRPRAAASSSTRIPARSPRCRSSSMPAASRSGRWMASTPRPSSATTRPAAPHRPARSLFPLCARRGVAGNRSARRRCRRMAGSTLKPILSGCSMGAFHAANFVFRFPELAAGVIALSGVYSTRDFFGAALDGGIYFNSPLDYLAGLTDERILERLRALRLIFCCGQGAWEERMIARNAPARGCPARQGHPRLGRLLGQRRLARLAVVAPPARHISWVIGWKTTRSGASPEANGHPLVSL